MIAKTLRVTLVLFLVALTSLGCAERKTAFRHQYHRTKYSLDAKSLRTLSLYPSMDILGKGVDPQNSQAGEHVFSLTRDTPGMVVDSGPDFLRVSFREGGTGAMFITDLSKKHDDYYYLATEEPGGALQKLDDAQDGVLRQDGVEFKIVSGNASHLLVDPRELQELFEAVSVKVEGRTE